MPPSIANLLELSTPTPENTPVQAYAKLEFGAYSFYVQSLSVTLGRKAAENDHVDVHLGNTKAISRQHARVQYSFARNCFEIYVGGRNGLFVDDIFYDQGSVVPLDDRFASRGILLILERRFRSERSSSTFYYLTRVHYLKILLSKRKNLRRQLHHHYRPYHQHHPLKRNLLPPKNQISHTQH
jgi:hypothetical protein